MTTLMQAVEHLRDRGTLPASGAMSLKDLHRRFQPTPSGSTRALLAKMFDGMTQKLPWAIILCRFKGLPPDPTIEPTIEQFIRDIFRPGSGGLVEYWRDVSLGMIDISGSRVFGWVELDLERQNAGNKKIRREGLINAAISASQRAGLDPINGFHKQIAVFTHDWARGGAPAGADWSDPIWGEFWIDGSADGIGRVSLPPHLQDGNCIAHEMGHGFGMNHDVGADLNIDYADPCCIMSQNNSFTHPIWRRNFGPALCLPHLMQRDWMYKRRVYYDAGGWLSKPEGITLPLAPIINPIARANLGIKLAYRRGGTTWDYYLEYVRPTEWNRGIGQDFLFIRRMAPKYGGTPAILGSIAVPSALGVTADFVEPTGNVKFQVERFDAQRQILKVSAKKL